MYIQTERLELKPITRNSLDVLAELLCDETVTQTYMVPDFACAAEAMPLAKRLMALSEGYDRLVAGIYTGTELIGILNETESNAEYIELGYALLPRYYHNLLFHQCLNRSHTNTAANHSIHTCLY